MQLPAGESPTLDCTFGSVFVTALPHNAHAGLVFAAIAIVFSNALVWHLFLALAFSHPRVQAAYARNRQTFSRLGSLAIGAFGLRLLVLAAQELRSKLGGGASAI
jgi:threonine efflux protein